jgi:hypothetical protein
MAKTLTEREVILRDTIWMKSLLRPLLVVLLVTCLVASFVAVAQVAVPGWGKGIALPFLLFISLESVYTTLWLSAPERRLQRTTRFRVGEVFVLLVLARIVALLIHGQWPTATLLNQWLRHPMSFIDGTAFFLGFLTLLSWGESALMMGILERMSLKPDELVTRSLSARWMDWNEVRARHPSRSQLLQEFSSHWLWGGLVLALCAGLSRVELMPASGQLMGISHLGLSPMLQIALVAYFLGGLLLMSQGRLAVLRSRWQYEGTPTDQAVVRRWGRLGLVMLAIVGLVAALLPFGSSFALAQILMAVINFMVQLTYALMLLMMTLLGWLMALMGLGGGIEQSPVAAEEPPRTTETITRGLQIPDWVGGALIWVIMTAIILYSVIAYLSGRGIRLNLTQLRRLWALLRAWWAIWRGKIEEAGRRVRAAITLHRASAETGERSRWRFLSLRQLDPRGRIRYFYLSTVRRASESGVPRKPSETPHEYQGDLETGWPELEPELTSLTEAFINARYSAHELRPEDARHVQEVWKRVKASLRRHHQG